MKPLGSEDAGDRAAFCNELAPHLADALEQMGIEDADLFDGRMLADTIFCLGYRKVSGPGLTEEIPDDRRTPRSHGHP